MRGQRPPYPYKALMFNLPLGHFNWNLLKEIPCKHYTCWSCLWHSGNGGRDFFFFKHKPSEVQDSVSDVLRTFPMYVFNCCPICQMPHPKNLHTATSCEEQTQFPVTLQLADDEICLVVVGCSTLMGVSQVFFHDCFLELSGSHSTVLHAHEIYELILASKHGGRAVSVIWSCA